MAVRSTVADFFLTRAMPCNAWLEESALGWLMVVWDQPEFERCLKSLAEPMFYMDMHVDIFRWLTSMAKKKPRPVFTTTFLESFLEFEKQCVMHRAETSLRFGRMLDNPFTNRPDFALAVKELRRLMAARQRIWKAERDLTEAWKAAEDEWEPSYQWRSPRGQQ